MEFIIFIFFIIFVTLLWFICAAKGNDEEDYEDMKENEDAKSK